MLQHRLRNAQCCRSKGHSHSARHNLTIRCSTGLSAACVKDKVRPITPRPLTIDADTGFVVNEACLSKVSDQWSDMLRGITAAYQQACGPDLVGVYLRGSLPKGFFIPHISDVDTFALVLEGCGQQNSLPSSNGSGSNCAHAEDGARKSYMLQQQQQDTVKRLADSVSQKYQQMLEFTKVEVRVLNVAPNCPAAAVLQQHIAAAHQLSVDPPSQSNDSSSHSSSGAAVLTPSMIPSIPAAFELKTQSVCLDGVDLPTLLPAAAALPPAVQLLPGLAEDVTAARDEAAAAALMGDVQRQIVAAKWTLKRLIRCAFELVQQQAGVWTRDLYWCCHYAGQYMPQLQQQLDQALELYVLLQRQQTTWRQQHRKSHQKPEQQQQREELQQDVAVAWEAIDSLLPHIETRFLKQMLTEEPGWLTKHIAGPIPASTYTAQQSRPTQKAAAVGAGSLQQQHQWRWSAVQESLQRLAAASGLVTPAAATHAAVEPAELLGARPPAVQIPIWGSVASYDWSVGAARTAACRHIQSVLLSKQQCSSPAVQAVHTAGFIQKGQGHRSELRSLPSSSYNGAQHADKCQQTRQDELFSCHPQPVVLRGLASGWPAVSGPEPWGLAWLSRQGFTSRVRAAPSLQFPFVEPQLVQLLQQIAGLAAAPSLELNMSAADFVERLQPHCQLPPLLYRPHEHYYMQAELSDDLKQQLRLQDLMQNIRTAAADTNNPAGSVPVYTLVQSSSSSSSSSHAAAPSDLKQHSTTLFQETPEPALQFSQAPRLWISPAGAVSPLHYDNSHSFLVQLRGYKRMLFFSPDQLYRLYCYPDTHLLRRRSRVNVAVPDFERFPLFRGAGALEVVLGPGDCVFFPSAWAHYTESLGEDLHSVVGCSLSVTFRIQ